MHLQRASTSPPPPGAAELLGELGAGENGFNGTSFGEGRASLDAFLDECRDWEDQAKVGPGLVPQTIYWLIDDRGHAVGMARVRRQLTQRLLQYGGNVGYYIRPSDRGRGYGTCILRLALEELRASRVARALVTTGPDNLASIGAILANGGVPDGQGRHVDHGEIVNRYWIDL